MGVDPEVASNFLDDFSGFCCVLADHFDRPITEIDRNVARAVSRTFRREREAYEHLLTSEELDEMVEPLPPPPADPTPQELDWLLDNPPPPEPKQPEPKVTVTGDDLDRMLGGK